MNINTLKTLVKVAFCCAFFSVPAFAEVGNLTNMEMKRLMADNIPVIDIRRPDEWQRTGVIQGSHLITFFDVRGHYNLGKWLSQMDKIAGENDKFILVCRSGNRTGQVAQFLDNKLGYKQIYHLKNGIKNWINANGKVISVN